jgi:hypothetical protein
VHESDLLEPLPFSTLPVTGSDFPLPIARKTLNGLQKKHKAQNKNLFGLVWHTLGNHLVWVVKSAVCHAEEEGHVRIRLIILGGHVRAQ